MLFKKTIRTHLILKKSKLELIEVWKQLILISNWLYIYDDTFYIEKKKHSFGNKRHLEEEFKQQATNVIAELLVTAMILD
jgi:hypothetical protein